VHANGVVEWSVKSTKHVRDPFNEIDLFFVVTAPMEGLSACLILAGDRLA